MTQTETPVQVNMIQYVELGLCRVDLLRVIENGAERWMVFFRTPSGPRVDTLSRVLRKSGGHFGSLNDNLGLVYEGQRDACAAFSALIDTVAHEAGAVERLPN